MSNFLAIATVTATLQRLLQTEIQADVPGASVTTVRPETSGKNLPNLGINIFLYQATPNPAWRNSDLRNRRPKGDLIKQAQAGLDLFYILSFYGNDLELEPQRLLGSAMRILVDHPIVTSEMIRRTMNASGYDFLAGSTLDQQVERVTIVPSAITTEELSKIWSVFFQLPYVLSFACQAGAVLIEGNKQTGRALPVRSLQFYTTPSQPIVEQIIADAGGNQPIVTNSTLTIRGKRLEKEGVKVKIGDARVTPQRVSEKEIQLELSALIPEEAETLRAGMQKISVLHPIEKRSPLEPDLAIVSNVMPLILCPTILDIEILSIWPNDELYGAEVRVQLDVIVGREQRVLLFLNQLSDRDRDRHDKGHIFAAKPRDGNASAVVFPILDVMGGDYLVRVQVDGAESPLLVDEETGYVDPVLEIG